MAAYSSHYSPCSAPEAGNRCSVYVCFSYLYLLLEVEAILDELSLPVCFMSSCDDLSYQDAFFGEKKEREREKLELMFHNHIQSPEYRKIFPSSFWNEFISI